MNIKYRVGIDVGGTNTDAVIIKSTFESSSDPAQSILAWHKSPTTPDITGGIASALDNVLRKSAIDRKDILFLSIGTTHFLNAVVEADPRRLSKVAVIRLAGPYTARCPPFIDFPPRLRALLAGHVGIIDGGLEIDGKEIAPVKDSQIKEQCEIIRAKKLRHVVVVGVFSPLATAGTQEEYVKKIMEDTLGTQNVNIVCSKDVGHIGLLERENAAILNTSILSFARRTISAYQEVLSRLNLKCPLYLTQLDGTLVPASVAASVPIRTFANGPTNSMRGASYLAGLDNEGRIRGRKSTIVVDVGGTTTDVGVLLPSGFPRKAAAFTEVGGVRTSFSMPDIYSMGLGGGSRVRYPSAGLTSVGPDSVGHAIQTSALICSGSTLTATDLAVAAGLPSASNIDFGNATRLHGVLDPGQIDSGIEKIRSMLEVAIDKMKTDPEDVSVLLVGGGSIIVPTSLAGVSEIIRPPFYEVANAVGAAIARVSGIIDRVEIPGGENGELEEIVERCKSEAMAKAVAAGASPKSVQIAEVTIIQLPYVANHASRIVVRAVGDIDFSAVKQIGDAEFDITISPVQTNEPEDEHSQEVTWDHFSQAKAPNDPLTYRPSVSRDGVWTLSVTDVEWIAEGCAVLGCGGGGATYAAFLVARQAILEGSIIRVIGSEHLKDNDAWILPCGFMGSPSVSSERIPSGQEIPTACKNLMRYLGVDKIAALISDEIGGKNGLEPMLLATQSGFDIPVIDGDLMGRAYPRLNQILPCIYKQNGLFPVAAADGVGNCMIVPSARDNATVEDMLRAACTALGSSIALSISPLRAVDLRQHAIAGTTSQAWRVGRAIASCRISSNLNRVAEAIVRLQDGKRLFVGKIIEVKREVRGGFTHGQITIAPLFHDELEGSQVSVSAYSDDVSLVIPFQNENLYAELRDDNGKKTLCSVPDLICVLDSQSGASIGTQDYRYGLRVTVIGLSCDPRWTTPKGLELGGPQAFGLDLDYKPIGTYAEPRSVIEEYCPTS